MNGHNLAILILMFTIGLSACSQRTAITATVGATPNPATKSQPTGKGGNVPTGPPASILKWERTGGIAGICQTMLINQDFTFQIDNCVSGQVIATGELTSGQSRYVQGLQNRFASFQWRSNPPPGSADMFMDQYTLFGNGSEIPSAEAQANINQDLANLANELINSNSPNPDS
jgi:hypothetical protein